MKLKNLLGLAILAALIIGIQSCSKDPKEDVSIKLVERYSSEVIKEWNDLYLEVERYAAGYRPTPAPRSLGYLGIAAYEACVGGMPSFNSLENEFSNLIIPQSDPNLEYHWPTVVNAIYGLMMPRFFENRESEINDLRNRLNDEFRSETTAEVFDRSVQHGEAVAEAVWKWAASDGIGHEGHKDPFRGYDWEANYRKTGDWVPTFPGPGNGMFPYWGQARTFALSPTDRTCRPPLTYSESTTSVYYSQAIEVYAQNTPSLSFTDQWIGEFWSDDLLDLTFSPGPRWIAIANQVYELENSNLETAIYCNAKVGMSLNDAAVGAWHSKYFYNIERPETYIKRLIDPEWNSNLNNPLTGEKSISPSFPAYPSGHATMGAAGAEALASVFGYGYSMTDNCHQYRTEFVGSPRSFTSFFEMAQENAWSRVPLGVHWRMDSDEGVRFGTEIARTVSRLPWKK